MIKKNKRQSKYFAPQNQNGDYHKCDYPGCSKAGEYRAPKDSKLKEYYWFCLEHVQEYNSNWNFYSGDFDFTEEPKRQTFKFSSHIKYNFGFDFNDGYDFFSKETYTAEVQLKLSDNEKVALKVMELQIDDLNEIELKKAYKKAVKKYHPDINLTNKNSEEIFKIISTAYKSLLGKITK